MTTTTATIQKGAHHGGLPTNTPTPGRARGEGVVQVVIMLAVAAMAGAASFRHVHDWTMHNSPAGTGDWFGWANAMVSELIPLAAGLEARRRHRLYGRAGAYPIALIIGAVALSLTGQLAEAKPGLSGWVISAVPALGFLALVKLVLSGPTTPAVATTSTAGPVPVVQLVDEHTDKPTTTITAHPEAVTSRTEETSSPESRLEVARLVPLARFAAVQHQQATGRVITVGELAARMSIAPAVAGRLLAELGHVTPAPVNGVAVLGGGA
jgi:hypothetical protein